MNNMNKHNHCHCPGPIPPRPIDAMAIERLWEKIKAHFATRADVLKIAEGLKVLEQTNHVQAIQSGSDGPTFPVGNDCTAHLEYENWVEGRAKDAAGRDVIAYNESTNAITAAAAAQVLKSMRQDIAKVNAFKVIICDNVDELGHPVTDSIDYNAIYMTPGGDGEKDSEWDEWIAVPLKNSTFEPFKWEHIGNKTIDLTWVSKDLGKLNKAIAEMNHKLKRATKGIADVMLNKAIRPLEDLRAYINSPEFIEYIFAELPRAAMGTDGLMTANSFAILSMLAIWASNDHKIMGGGALGPDVVIHMFEHQGVPVDDLKKRFLHHHHCHHDCD